MSGNMVVNQNDLREEVYRQLAIVAANPHEMRHNESLFSTIDGVKDPTIRGEILKQYLAIIERHQQTKDTVNLEEVRSRIKIEQQRLDYFIECGRKNSELFSNRPLLLFLWCFPVLAGFLSIKFLESYTFAFFIVIVLYGVLIALWFSKPDGLASTWNAFNRRDP